MYSHLVLGGTFDHFHAGHEKLLTTAFSLSNKVLLGLTTSGMNQNKAWNSAILPFEERKREIEAFARGQKRLSDLEIIQIKDVYGTTLEDDSLDAILVTPHSEKGARMINEGRKKKGLKELPIHICELLSDDSGEVLSSTRIRAGLVSRTGQVYSHLFHHTLQITQDIKEYVRKPLGDVHFTFPDTWEDVPLIFVGDVVTKSAVEAKLDFASAWIDGKSSRAPYLFPVHLPYRLEMTNIKNAPGTISHEAASFMEEQLLVGKAIFEIVGEEDLLTLPAILLSPLGSRVTYGNPYGQKGITVVNVTEEKKAEICSLL